MDIADMSIAMSQTSLGQKVGVAVAKMSMETATQDAEALTKLMELSVNPSIGKNFDVSV